MKPFAIVLAVLAFGVVFISALFLSFVTTEATLSGTLTLSQYTVQPSVPEIVTIDITSNEFYPLNYVVTVRDANTNDLANHDGVITYEPIYGTLNQKGFATHRITVHPTQEHQQYLVKFVGVDGRLFDEKRLTVIAYD